MKSIDGGKTFSNVAVPHGDNHHLWIDPNNNQVMINSNDEIWIERRLIDPRALRANIERMHAENPEGSVVIQADKESKTDTLIQVMDAARSAGVFNVSIAANEP